MFSEALYSVGFASGGTPTTCLSEFNTKSRLILDVEVEVSDSTQYWNKLGSMIHEGIVELQELDIKCNGLIHLLPTCKRLSAWSHAAKRV